MTQATALRKIIRSPHRWSQHLGAVAKEGLPALLRLLEGLRQLPGPISKARQYHVQIGISAHDNSQPDLKRQLVEEAQAILESPNVHPLLRAMALTAFTDTPEAQMYVTQQPERLQGANLFTPIGQEAQMRLDFLRAQCHHELGQDLEAIFLYRATLRFSEPLDVSIISRVCHAKMDAIAPTSVQEKIKALLEQALMADQEEDVRSSDHIRELLCIQYGKQEDYLAFLAIAEEMSPTLLSTYLVAGARLLLGLPLPQRKPLPALDAMEYQPFAVMTHILYHFRLLRQGSNRAREDLSRAILDPIVPTDLGYPIASVLATCFQAMTYTTLGQYDTAHSIIGRLQEKVEYSWDVSPSAQHYVDMAYGDLLVETRPQDLGPILKNLAEALPRNRTLESLLLLSPKLAKMLGLTPTEMPTLTFPTSRNNLN